MRVSRLVITTTLIAILTLSAAAARTGDGLVVQAAWRTERATAGDTTIVRTVGAATTVAELRLVPEATIGKADGADEDMFTGLLYLTPTPDGGLVLYETGSSQVRQFDARGRFVRTFGRRGQGPGEYSDVSSIVVQDDGHLYLTNTGNRRIQRYSPVGAFVGSFPSPATNPPSGGSLVATPRDGLVHIRIPMCSSPCASLPTAIMNREAYNVVVRTTDDGTVRDTLVEPKGTRSPRWLTHARQLSAIGAQLTPGASSTAEREIPLEPYPATSYNPLGFWMFADPVTYAITLDRRTGGPLRIESDLPAVIPSAAERRGLLERFRWELRGLDPSAAPALSLIPERKPFFRFVSGDEDGRAWVALHRPGRAVPLDTTGRPPLARMVRARDRYGPPPREIWEEPIAYDIFAPGGEFMGRLALPARTTFGASKGRNVWLIHRDSLDVRTIVRYAVVTSSPSAPSAALWR